MDFPTELAENRFNFEFLQTEIVNINVNVCLCHAAGEATQASHFTGVQGPASMFCVCILVLILSFIRMSKSVYIYLLKFLFCCFILGVQKAI